MKHMVFNVLRQGELLCSWTNATTRCEPWMALGWHHTLTVGCVVGVHFFRTVVYTLTSVYTNNEASKGV